MEGILGTTDPCDLKRLLEETEGVECYRFHRPLFAAAEEAEKTGDEGCAALLRILAAAASLHLKPNDAAEPLIPMMQLEDRRTAAAEDFGEDEVKALRDVLRCVEPPDLRARIGDLLWIVTRDHEMASLAVDEYLRTAQLLEHPEHWPPVTDRLHRAAQIARSLGRESKELDQVRRAVSGMLDRHAGDDPLFLSARLIELLLEFGGRDAGDLWHVASRVAERARDEGDWHRAESYRQVAAACRAATGNQEEADRERALGAEVLVDQAASEAEGGAFLVAAAHLDRAIQGLRQIPGTRERVGELQALLLAYQREGLKEMRPVSFEVETRALTDGVVEKVTGHPWPEVFRVFAQLGLIPRFQDLRESAERLVRDHPLSQLFGSMRLNEDGRVVARAPAVSFGSEEGLELGVRGAMLHEASLRHALMGQAVIEPGRAKIRDEHDTGPDTILPLLGESPFVPEDRRIVFARGVSAGFDGDYLTAAHLLVPQLENGVRRVLANHGVQVTSMDRRGIQRERDLNYLLYQDIAEEVLTPGVTFELQALLVDPWGANFRNRLAHGLLPDAALSSPVAAYVWWISMFLTQAFSISSESDYGG
jgi:hypothetical protein